MPHRDQNVGREMKLRGSLVSNGIETWAPDLNLGCTSVAHQSFYDVKTEDRLLRLRKSDIADETHNNVEVLRKPNEHVASSTKKWVQWHTTSLLGVSMHHL